MDTKPGEGELITVNPSTSWIQNQNRVNWFRWIYQHHGYRTRTGWVDYSESINVLDTEQDQGELVTVNPSTASKSINIMDTEPVQGELVTVRAKWVHLSKPEYYGYTGLPWHRENSQFGCSGKTERIDQKYWKKNVTGNLPPTHWKFWIFCFF